MSPLNAKCKHQCGEVSLRSSLPQASHGKDTLVSLQPLCFVPARRYEFKWSFCMSKCFGTDFLLHFLRCCCRRTSLSWNFNRKRCFVLAAQRCCCPPGAQKPMRLCWISSLPFTRLRSRSRHDQFLSVFQKFLVVLMRAKTRRDTGLRRCNYTVQSAV